MYYVFTDHLGSYDKIYDDNNVKKEEYSFDACSVSAGRLQTTVRQAASTHQSRPRREGRRRNPTNWTYSGTITYNFTSRGFTGHEHLDGFDIINMNGRCYDPNIGRFLSPDNYVQMPDFTQNFNRYAYCLNNPLIYTDPDGEIALLAAVLIGGGIFGTGNLISHAINGDVDNFWDGAKYFSQGFLAGATLSTMYMFSPPGVQMVMEMYAANMAGSYAVSSISGLGQGIFTGDWNALGNANEIFLGNFYISENAGFLEGVWQGVSKHTYEMPFTGLGHSFAQLRNSLGMVDDVLYLDGNTAAINYEAGILESKFSLGCFVNFGTEDTEDDFILYNNNALLHEFGHSIQSRKIGPGYLYIAVRSLLSAGGRGDLDENGVTEHSKKDYEKWANWMAKKYYKGYYDTWPNRSYPTR